MACLLLHQRLVCAADPSRSCTAYVSSIPPRKVGIEQLSMHTPSSALSSPSSAPRAHRYGCPPPVVLFSRPEDGLVLSAVRPVPSRRVRPGNRAAGRRGSPRCKLVDEEIFGIPRDVAQPLGLLLVGQFVLFIGVGAVIPTLPLYAKAIGLSSALSGVVISAPALALLLLARPSGGLADRARKPPIVGGLLLVSLSDLGTACADGLGAIVAARLGLGAGRAVSEAAERALLADLAARRPSLRGRALGAQQAAAAAGIAVGAPLGGVLVERQGVRAPFVAVAAAAAAAAALYTALPETATPRGEGGAAGGGEGGVPAGAWRALLKDARWRGLSLAEMGTRFGSCAKVASVPVLAATVLPGGAAAAGVLLSLAGVSGLVGAPVGGWLSDRKGARFTALTAGYVSSLGLLLVPVALALPTEQPLYNGLAFGALILVWSVAVSAQGPAFTAIAQELAPKGAEATALALPRAVGDAVYIVAPFILGLVTDTVPIRGAECGLAGGLSLLGVSLLAWLGECGD